MSKPVIKSLSTSGTFSIRLVSLLLTLFFLNSCSSMSDSEKLEIFHTAYKEAEYNKKIEKYAKKLENLNAYLYPKIDTILKSEKISSYSHKEGATVVTLKERRSVIIWYDQAKKYIPPIFFDEIMFHWENIGKDLLKGISINKGRYLNPYGRNSLTLRYLIAGDHLINKSTLYYEDHIILYNDSLAIVDKINNPLSNLVKEVYVGKLDSLKYYIVIRPNTGF